MFIQIYFLSKNLVRFRKSNDWESLIIFVKRWRYFVISLSSTKTDGCASAFLLICLSASFRMVQKPFSIERFYIKKVFSKNFCRREIRFYFHLISQMNQNSNYQNPFRWIEMLVPSSTIKTITLVSLFSTLRFTCFFPSNNSLCRILERLSGIKKGSIEKDAVRLVEYLEKV